MRWIWGLVVAVGWATLGEAAVIITPPGVTCAADVRLQAPVQGQDYCLQSTDQTQRTWNGSVWVDMNTGGGTVSGSGVAEQVTEWVGATVLGGHPALRWTASPPAAQAPVFAAPARSLSVGGVPQGTLVPGQVFVGLNGPSDSVGMQAIQAQVYQGAPGLAGLVTLGDDRVGISSWNFRSTGATNPIYGANFGVVFSTSGVANGLEIDVQNMTGVPVQGQALWLNGSGVSGRANAILIDTQDATKWDRGILFKEGFVGGGATGSISGMGIHFERSQDADFIVIQPRVGTLANVAMKLTNPEFTENRFALLNSGAIRVGSTMTGAAFPSYAFVEEGTTGLYLEATSVLGFAVKSGSAGVRRMTLDTALNVWNSGTGANEGGGINLYDNTAVHSVGFLAADVINNSFRIRLPAEKAASAGLCVKSDGGSPIETWSYATCGTGTPGSGTVTNTGNLTANALVIGNGLVDVTALGSLGTTTTLLHGNAGGPPTWAAVSLTADVSGVLPVASGGTGLASGTSGGVLAYTASGTLVSSGALPAGLPVIGGGAGAAPTVGTRSGNTTSYVTSSGTLTSGTCVQWDANGNATSTGSACGAGGGGTGLTSLNGSTLSTQTFPNVDANLSMVTNTGAGTHTLTWAGLLSAARGGTGVNTAGISGVPVVSSGTWTFPGQLPTASGGTGTTGGTAGQVAYWAASSLTGSAGHVWDNATTLLTVGTVGTGTPVAGQTALFVSGSPGGTTPVTRIEAVGGGTTSARTPLQVVHTTAGGAAAADGFTVNHDFVVRSSNVDRTMVRLSASRTGGSDGTAAFALQTRIGDVLADRLAINGIGQFFYIPTPSVGTFGLTAIGTRTTELQFYTNNNLTAVGLVAPATSTGNHIWRLPTTFGVLGSVLGNDGAGNLSWATAVVLDSAQLGPAPAATQATGPLKVSVSNSDNVNPYQSILAQMVNGAATDAEQQTIANDKVAVSGRAFRGAGGSSPIYGANFGVNFSTTGVANGVEIGVQNNSGTNGIGQGLWINGNGSNSRDNAILIDTQNSSKWTTGIRFNEGNLGGGATGTIAQFGIIFDKSSDADFLVIRPRVGANNSAIRITDPAFAVNTFIVTNTGDVTAAGSLRTGSAPFFGPAGSINVGGDVNANNIGVSSPSGQYFARGFPGYTGVITLCGGTITVVGGIIVGTTC